MKRKNIFILFSISILPLLLLFVVFFNRSKFGSYFMHTVDPEYAYLFSGLTLANGDFSLGHIDHPGTPLQWLIALILRLGHLISGEGTFNADVMANAEYYLQLSNSVLIIFFAISLFIVGYIVWRTTKQWMWALFIQLSPLVSVMAIGTLVRVTPEPMLLSATLLLIAALLWYLFSNQQNQQIRAALLFGLIVSFSIAIKITFIPLAILPFFVLQTKKQHLVYVASSILLLPVFAFPLVDQFVKFSRWVKNLLLFSGKYGGGEKNVVDKQSFITHIGYLFEAQTLFFVILFIAIVFLVSALFWKKYCATNQKRQLRLLLGLVISMLLQLLIVAKHFAYHYMLPALLLIVPVIFLMLLVFYQTFLKQNNRYVLVAAFGIFAVFLLAIRTPKITHTTDWHQEQIRLKQPTQKFLTDNAKNTPLLILPSYYGTVRPEYGLMFGNLWTVPKIRQEYAVSLKQLYPQTFFFHPDKRRLYDWYNTVLLYDILRLNDSLYVYFGEKNETWEQQLAEKLYLQPQENDSIFTFETVFANQNTNETVALLHRTQPLDSFFAVSAFICNAELLTEGTDSLLASNGLSLNGVQYLTEEKAFDGKHSVLLSKKGMGAFEMHIQPQADEIYRATIWRYAPNKKGTFVAQGENFYQESSTVVERNDNGWEKIEISLDIPPELYGKTIRVYVKNNDNLPVYFDALEITTYRVLL